MSDSNRSDYQPLDLHAAANASEAAGFNHTIQLQRHQAAHLARSLRGIDAVNRILISTSALNIYVDPLIFRRSVGRHGINQIN